MARKKVFISFDYDNDSGSKHMLAGQAKLPGSPFDFTDASIKRHLTGDWKEKVLRRMQKIDVVVVLCGARTDQAIGVQAEVEIAKRLGKPLVFLSAYSDAKGVLPKGAGWFDIIHRWTWENLKSHLS